MAKKICVNFLCIMLLCVSSLFVFSACGEKNYTYSEFQEAYSNYVTRYTYSTQNTNTIFDNLGYVLINYDNAKLMSAIKSTTNSDYELMYTRLSQDASSSQAVLEPALKSSMLLLHNYIAIEPEKAVPSSRVNSLMKKLDVLKERTNAFTIKLIKFQARGDDFDKNSAIDRSFLQYLLTSYYDMLIASCELSMDFSDVANTYFWKDVENSSTGRLASGKIERYYLTELTQLVDTYARFDLATFYSQAYIIDGKEYFTSRKPADKINTMLTLYLENINKLRFFDNSYTAGEMDETEKAVIASYNSAVSYDTVYKGAYDVASLSLSRMGDPKVDLDAKVSDDSATQAHRLVVSNFVQNEFQNKLFTMINLMKSVKNLA